MRLLSQRIIAKGYKRKGQKYKSLLVWQVLLKRTDEEHPLSVDDIQDHLRMYGMETERRSIYRDIKDLKALLETDYKADIEDRERLGYEIGYTRKLSSTASELTPGANSFSAG